MVKVSFVLFSVRGLSFILHYSANMFEVLEKCNQEIANGCPSVVCLEVVGSPTQKGERNGVEEYTPPSREENKK